MSAVREEIEYWEPSDFRTPDLMCKVPSIRHSWEPCVPPPPRAGTLSSFGEQHSFACTRCPALKHEVWDRRTGKRIGKPRIVYPGGRARMRREITNDDLRKEIMIRWAEKPPKLVLQSYE